MQKSHRFKEKQNKITYVDLILPLAIPRLLTYQLSNDQIVKIGQRVLVHVGKKGIFSYSFKIHFNKPDYPTKNVIEVINRKSYC